MVSINPSIWIPPFIRMGRAVRTAQIVPLPAPRRSSSQNARTLHNPVTAPTSGKKQSVYRMFSFSHPICGIGILE